MSATFLLLVALTCQFEPLRDSMKLYVAAFESVSADAERLATVVRSRYPETWYTFSEDSVTSVFSTATALDTALVDTARRVWRTGPLQGQKVLRFDYEAMFFARDRIRLAVQGLVPGVNAYLKTARVRDDFEVFSSLDTVAGSLKVRLDELRGAYWAVRAQDTAFKDSLPGRFDGRHLKSLHGWYKIALALQGMRITEGLKRYEIRYGSTSEQLNFLEVLIGNAVLPFRGNQAGPSAYEPIILRVTPVCYDVTDNRSAWLVQLVGVNGYLFGDDGIAGLAHKIGMSHLGIAITVADVTGNPLLKWPAFNSLAWGGMVHLGKFQVGGVTNFRSGFKIISTVDLHLIPGFIM